MSAEKQTHAQFTELEKCELLQTLKDIKNKQDAIQSRQLEHGSQLDAQDSKLEKLELGMYGDEKLKIPGLIADMKTVKKWINQQKLKVALVAGGIGVLWWIFQKFIDKWIYGGGGDVPHH